MAPNTSPPLHSPHCGSIRQGLILLCLMLGCLIGMPVMGAIRDVEPGEPPTLAADEALPAVGVDSDVDLETVRILRDDGRSRAPIPAMDRDRNNGAHVRIGSRAHDELPHSDLS